MSHFTVMVIGDDAEKQLAPYHEYECTGVDDEYVIDVDCTEEVNKWLEKTIWVGIDKKSGEPDYHLSEKQAEEHLDDWSVMARKAWLESTDADLDQEIDDWFGYNKNDDGTYFQHTNPNAKWDWYLVGGRWSGFFKVKNPAEAHLGEKSWMNKDKALTPEYADVTTKGNIDLEGMMVDSRVEHEKRFDHLAAAIGDIKPISWTELREEYEANGKTIDDAREAYHESDFKKAIDAYEKEHDVRIGGWTSNMYDDYYLHLPLKLARVRYVETAALNVVTPYAFIKDSQWVQRGEMGWWGMSSNEKDKDEWTKMFYEMFKALPDDTLITVVDCHI